MDRVIERFVKYTSFDTQSDENTKTHPSTSKQYAFAEYLARELESLGLKDIALDQAGYLTATLPANTDKKLPVIGFIAHMDTSPDMSGKNVKPAIIENYDGAGIVLNREKEIVMSPAEFPELLKYKGEDLVVTDGMTLLGADDKAGISEIVSAVEYLLAHSDIIYGKVRVCFTPDEEIGEGADNFNVEGFGADFAYTVDGGELGELEYENFNAAVAKVTINGKNVHPGYSKGKMVNSILIGMELNSMLPPELPSNTEGYEGFYHLNDFAGSVEKTSMKILVRDHDLSRFAARKKTLEDIAVRLNEKYGRGAVVIDMKDQYYNMKEKIEPVMHIVELAKEAMDTVGAAPRVKPIRGGTDGARLSFMGLPTPNIFTGGHNFHGKYEFIPVSSMKKAVETIVKIIELSAV